jgi:ABC-type antimicrobial peptide transport system permease subunit
MLAYMITRRVREIAIRVAIGAKPSQVTWLTLRESLILIVVGTAIGIPLSIAMSRAIRSQLFGVAPESVSAIAFAVITMLLLAAAAVWIPTRRATRVNPSIALRVE